MFLLKLVLLGTLSLLFIQDLKSRSVQWILFPVLAAGFLAIRMISQSPVDILYSVGASLAFLVLQLFILTVYFSFKQKKLIILTDNLLGLGDILFLITLAFYLSPLNYIIFYVLSLVLIVFGWVIWLQMNQTGNQHIPFAGLQALLFGGVFLFLWVLPAYNLFDDYKLIQIMSR